MAQEDRTIDLHLAHVELDEILRDYFNVNTETTTPDVIIDVRDHLVRNRSQSTITDFLNEPSTRCNFKHVEINDFWLLNLFICILLKSSPHRSHAVREVPLYPSLPTDSTHPPVSFSFLERAISRAFLFLLHLVEGVLGLHSNSLSGAFLSCGLCLECHTCDG